MKRYFCLLIFGILLAPFHSYAQIVMDFQKDFGAKGDGYTDDSKAWSDAINYLSGKKNIELFIPKGTYIIGKQVPAKAKKAFFSAYTQKLSNAHNISIIGEVDASGKIRSKFKYQDGIYFGYFLPNGKPADKMQDQFVAELSDFIRIERGSKNISIKNIEIDGNLGKAQLGTQKRHNLQFIGIYVNGSENTLLENIYTHHMGLDGVYIRAPYNGKSENVVLNNVISEYNGRQGLSFTSGQGLRVYNSKFRYTGKGGLSLSPSANVDIENHAGPGLYLTDILFDNCELYDNAGGSGSLNLAGKIKNFKVTNSTIATTNWIAIQGNYTSSRDFTFENCEILGTIEFQINSPKPKIGNEITRFINCTISDNKNNKEVGRNRSLINVFDNVSFENCTFYIWHSRKLIRSYKNGAADKKKIGVQFTNSSFYDLDTKKTINTNNLSNISTSPERIKIRK